MVPRALSTTPQLTLASASPQRRAILTQLGVAFTVRPADVDELTAGDPAEVARANAVAKAEAVDGDLVLGVDTVVTVDGAIFGKPADANAALATLRILQGRAHDVVSGIAVRDAAGTRSDVETTTVRFTSATDEELRRYVARGEWQGRAGGYAIQESGAWLIESITGDYLNIVGLPVTALHRLLPDLL